MQEQTAHLHRQFLDGQDAAHRSVHLLVEQQQRLLQASLGLPAGRRRYRGLRAESSPQPKSTLSRRSWATRAPRLRYTARPE